MHVLFVHPNFPAQFGHIAAHLAEAEGWRCTFVSETPPERRAVGGRAGLLEKVQYRTAGGATPRTHFCSRTFENAVWHTDAVYRALLARPDVEPDLIVGHSGFGSTLFLRELYPSVPTVNLFEYYYRGHAADSDMTFRRDLGWQLEPEKFLRSRCRNAMILLDLDNCQVGYCPTPFQRSRFPAEFQPKLRVVFDGIDTNVWRAGTDADRPPARSRGPRTLAGVDLPARARVVTYCSRGFEAMRGFDVFLRGMRRLLASRDDVHVFVVGTDRVAYGGDGQYTGGLSFKDWTLAHDDVRGIDLARVHFVGRLEPPALASLFAASDLHVYLTVPFVLSWSMINAMSCGAAVLAGDTAPVRDAITHDETGTLFDFFDPGDLADRALTLLADEATSRRLGDAAAMLVRKRYALDVVLPQMRRMYDEAAQVTAGLEDPRPRDVLEQSTMSPFAG